MGWRIVKQPDGRLARFSSIVDSFTHVNMSSDEAVNVCIEEGLSEKDAKKKVDSGIRDIKPWTVNIEGSGTDRWKDCLETIIAVHGQKEIDEVLSFIEEN